MSNSPAIFLDRDGTIIEDRGYLKNAVDVVFLPGCFNALTLLKEHFELFIITNQSGISKGITNEEDVIDVNNHIINTLNANDISIREIFYCPHKTEDNCSCKKPNPFFINKAAELYNLNLADSFIIGDHPSDALCGINAGVTPIFLLTGHGTKHQDELPRGIKVCENIFDAAKYILEKK
jgi:D-glycero-D-manno-heptose 1,7-bisphosphate phosphatase